MSKRVLGITLACLAAFVALVVGATTVAAVVFGAGARSESTLELTPEATANPVAGGASGAPTEGDAPSASPTTAAPATARPLPSATPVPTRAAVPVPVATPAPPRPTTTPRRTAAALLPVVGVTDGDTIKVRVGGVTERVRVIGIDTPELRGDECWAQKASSKMQSLVQSRSVRLVADPTQADRDRYGRLLRHVVTQDGRLAAQVLIEGGFGKEYTYDAAYEHRSAYLAAQKRAKAKRLGVWSAACAAPVLAARPPAGSTGTAAPVKPSGTCVIKGNISSKGEKIYHVPGGGSYDVTVITPSKGERWFCTEQEAVAAGWRRARN